VKFDDAIAAFRTADQNLGRIQTRLTDTHAKLLQAGMDVAAIDRKIEEFAQSTDADPTSAAHLIGQQERARNVALLLEQAEDFLERKVSEAKVAVASAERACAQVQADFHRGELDTQLEAFLQSNASQFQRLVQTLHLAGMFAQVAEGKSAEAARNTAPRHVEALVLYALPDAVKDLWANDERFRAGCVPTKFTPISSVVASEHVSHTERLQARIHGHIDAPSSVDDEGSEEDWNPAFAQQSSLNAAESARHHRAQVEHYRDRLAQRPGDQSIKDSIDTHTREAARFEAIVKRWAELIEQHSERAAA